MRKICISVSLVFLIFLATDLSAQKLSDVFEIFFSDKITDIAVVKNFIGKDITRKEMLDLSRKYSETGIVIQYGKDRLGIGVFSSNSKILILLEPVAKADQHPIWDIASLTLAKGEDVFVQRILIQSKYDKNGAVESPSEIGLLVCKAGVPVPTDKRIVPTYIITVGPDSKLQIRKPTDNSKFIFVQGGYI